MIKSKNISQNKLTVWKSMVRQVESTVKKETDFIPPKYYPEIEKHGVSNLDIWKSIGGNVTEVRTRMGSESFIKVVEKNNLKIVALDQKQKIHKIPSRPVQVFILETEAAIALLDALRKPVARSYKAFLINHKVKEQISKFEKEQGFTVKPPVQTPPPSATHAPQPFPKINFDRIQGLLGKNNVSEIEEMLKLAVLAMNCVRSLSACNTQERCIVEQILRGKTKINFGKIFLEYFPDMFQDFLMDDEVRDDATEDEIEEMVREGMRKDYGNPDK